MRKIESFSASPASCLNGGKEKQRENKCVVTAHTDKAK